MPELLQEIELFGSDIPWLEGLREKAKSSFRMPGVKDEAWKYTKLHSLNTDDFTILPSNFLLEIQGDLDMEEDCDCVHSNCECHLAGEDHDCTGPDNCSCHSKSCHECDCHTVNETDSHCGCKSHSHGMDIEASGCSCSCSQDNNCFLDLPFDAYQLHFSNGKFVPIYPATPRGLEVMTLMQALLNEDARKYLNKHLDMEKYPFAALNTAYLEEGLFIRVQKGISLEKPLMIVNHSRPDTKNIFANIRNIIILENRSRAELLEYYHYTGEVKSRYFNNIVNEIYVSAQAELHHYKLQDEAFKAVHIALNSVRIKEGGIYNAFCLQKGADLGRNETNIALLAEQAQATADSAYLMNGWATLDTTTLVEHLAPLTYSTQLIKGVIGGEARGVFQGKIHIAPLALETEGRLLHKAMLLSDTAEIDVKPELEIFADNVKCSHGAACGELDKEQLFYMRSRGIGEEEAKQILIDAYLDEVLDHIYNGQIKDWIKKQIRE